jgi:hypothetical protein
MDLMASARYMGTSKELPSYQELGISGSPVFTEILEILELTDGDYIQISIFGG